MPVLRLPSLISRRVAGAERREAPGPKPAHLGRRLRLRRQPAGSWLLWNGGVPRGVPWCSVNLRLKVRQDRRQNGQEKSPKKRKIKRRITIRKRIKSTMKIKSPTSCTRPKGEGPDARRSPRRRGEFRPALPPTPSLALALSSLPDPTLDLSLCLLCERAACQPARRGLTGHQGLLSRIVMSCSYR